MALRAIGLLITLVLMAWAATALRPDLLAGDTSKQPVPEALLQQAGSAVERAHQLTGTYVGAQTAAASSGLRLAAADANGYCLELTWVGGDLYHLRGPGGRAAEGRC